MVDGNYDHDHGYHDSGDPGGVDVEGNGDAIVATQQDGQSRSSPNNGATSVSSGSRSVSPTLPMAKQSDAHHYGSNLSPGAGAGVSPTRGGAARRMGPVKAGSLQARLQKLGRAVEEATVGLVNIPAQSGLDLQDPRQRAGRWVDVCLLRDVSEYCGPPFLEFVGYVQAVRVRAQRADSRVKDMGRSHTVQSTGTGTGTGDVQQEKSGGGQGQGQEQGQEGKDGDVGGTHTVQKRLGASAVSASAEGCLLRVLFRSDAMLPPERTPREGLCVRVYDPVQVIGVAPAYVEGETGVAVGVSGSSSSSSSSSTAAIREIGEPLYCRDSLVATQVFEPIPWVEVPAEVLARVQDLEIPFLQSSE